MTFSSSCRRAFLAALALTEPFTLALPQSVFHARQLDNITHVKSSYDYIIVGGGTSGLTVADRLTEDGKTTVLVVENGPMGLSPQISEIRGGTGGFGSGFMYPTRSVPQVNLMNRSYPVLAGNVVGGSSAVNAMMTVRGTSEDYDRWGDFFGGASSWSWEGLLPYFKKALTFTLPDETVTKSAGITYDTKYWGNTSQVYAGWPSYQYPGIVPQIEAFKDIPGVEFPTDSGAGRAGVYWFPTFMDPTTVTRSYARTGHYSNVNRSNYELITESHVAKIMLAEDDKDGVSATGVTFKQTRMNMTSYVTVRAKKEVILAAGAVHTPQVLQRSGVGPKKILDVAGIKVMVDLPGVGQNFQDHPMMSVMITLRNFTFHPNPGDLFSNRNFSAWADQQWERNRSGPYSLGIGNVAAWLGMPAISPENYEALATKLEEQDHAAQLPRDTHPTVIEGYKAQMKALASSIRSPNTAFYSLSLTGSFAPAGAGVLLHPVSRGSINIDPRDPWDSEPLVDYRALSNPLDVAIMVEFIRFARTYHFNTSLSMYGPQEMSPGADIVSDEDLGNYVRRTVTPSEFHPSGTCAMLPKELGGVVNQSLRVYGVNNLRVVDASIMPTLPGANTCQTVYTVAEKAADLIKSGK